MQHSKTTCILKLWVANLLWEIHHASLSSQTFKIAEGLLLVTFPSERGAEVYGMSADNIPLASVFAMRKNAISETSPFTVQLMCTDTCAEADEEI